MKRRNGFTLVELLAVIAILAILVIIALPNVINLYNRARKSAFLTEAQNVLKTTTNKVIEESVSGKKINVVSNTKNPLNLTGEKINYNVKLDNQGKIKDYVISNDNFCISSKKEYDKLAIDDIKEDCSYDELHNIVGTLKQKFYEVSGKTKRDIVNSIVFYNDGRVIDDVDGSFDVSEAQDKSIIMYVKTNSSSLIDLTIVADGMIYLPEDSSQLFAFSDFRLTGGPNDMSFYKGNLTKIDFNDTVDTSKVTNMRSMFLGCAADHLDIRFFNTSNVTNMSGMFRDAKAMKIDGLENFDTAKVTNMQSMFYDSYVTNLDLSSFNTSNVTYMSYMFRFGQMLEINGLSNFNTSKVNDMSFMFYGLNLDLLDLSSFNTANVTNMEEMFRETEVKTLNLTSFNVSNVRKMENMFSGFKAETLNLGNFKTSKVTNMRYMFSRTEVPVIDVSSFDTRSVTDMYGMFSYSKAKEIKGLDKFNTSNVTTMGSMFSWSSAETLDVSKFNTAKVTNMEWMFCSAEAKEIKGLNNFKTSKVTSMSRMFNSTKTSLLDLSSFDVSNVKDFKYMFSNATAKVGYAKDQLSADKFNDSSVTNIPTTLKFTVK